MRPLKPSPDLDVARLPGMPVIRGREPTIAEYRAANKSGIFNRVISMRQWTPAALRSMKATSP